MTKLRLASVFLVAAIVLLASGYIMQFRWIRMVRTLAAESKPTEGAMDAMWAFFQLTYGITFAGYACLLVTFVIHVQHILATRKAARESLRHD